MIYINVDSPNLGSPYFNFLGEAQCKKTPCTRLQAPNFTKENSSFQFHNLYLNLFYCQSKFYCHILLLNIQSFIFVLLIFSKLNIFFDAASLPDNEFFVDRDPGSFNTVLNYHRFKIQTLSVCLFFVCLFDCKFLSTP